MIQAGHANQVTDLSWCPDSSRGIFMLASVSAAYEEEEGDDQETYVDMTRSASAQSAQGILQSGPRQHQHMNGEDDDEAFIQDHNVQIWRPSEDLFS
jgi:hypothetical protein